MGLKSKIIKLKNSLERFNIRVDQAEKKKLKSQRQAIGNIQLEEQKERMKNVKYKRLFIGHHHAYRYVHWGTFRRRERKNQKAYSKK